MRDVIVQMYSGRSGTEKREMADRSAQVLHDVMGCEFEKISLAVDEIDRRVGRDGRSLRIDIAAVRIKW